MSTSSSNLYLNHSQNLYWVIDHDFKLLDANKAYLNLAKFSAGAELHLNQSIFTGGHFDGNIEKWKAYYQKALNGAYFEIKESYFNPKSKATEHIQVLFEPLKDDDNHVFAVACLSKEITALAHQEMEANKLMNSSLDVFCTIDELGDFVYVSAASAEHWGYTPQELVGTSFLDLVLEEDLAKTLELTEPVQAGLELKTFVNRYKKKNGGLAYNLWSVTWDKDAKVMHCVARDAKDQIEQEQKLLQNEQRLNALISGSFDLIGIIDQEGIYTYMSPSSTAIAGISPEEFIGTNAFEYIHDEDAERVLESLKKVTDLGRVAIKPFRVKNSKNEWRWLESILSDQLNNPAIKGIVINSKDVTESVEQEERIVLTEKRFESLIRNSADCFLILSPAGKTSYVSEAVQRILGYSKEEAEVINIWDLIHPEDIADTQKALEHCLKKPGVPMKGSTARIKHKNGSWRWVETSITNLINDPAVGGIVDVFRDVTEQVEEKHQLKLLESVITHTNDAVLITEAEPFEEPGPKIIYVNEAFTKMTGYTAEEVLGKTPRILQGPNSNFGELEKLGQALRNWQPYEITTLNYKKNGEPFWINFSVTPVANDTGWYTHWIAIERDVTERKNQELQNKLLAKISVDFGNTANLFEATKEICKTIGEFGGFDWVEVWTSNFEFSRMELLSHFVANPTHEEFYNYNPKLNSLEIAKGLIGQVWDKKAQLIWDHEEINKKFLRKKAANKIGLQAILGLPLISNNEVIGVLKIGTKQDINYLKNYAPIFKKLEGHIGSELNRKKLENDLSHLFSSLPGVISVLDFKGKFLKINSSGAKLFGYGEEAILNKNIDAFTHADEKGAFTKKVNALKKKEKSFEFESRLITKAGESIWLSWFCSPIQEEGLVYARAKDISEEKRLRELNKQVSILAKIGSWEVYLEDQSAFWSDEVHEIHETDPKTFVPFLGEAINFYRADFREMVEMTINNTIATGEPWDFEAVIVTAKKNEVWVRAIGNAQFENGKCVRLYGGFQDIQSQKESENRLVSLADNLPGVVYEYHIHPDGTDSIKNINGQVEELWGFSAKEVMDNLGLVWAQIEAGGKMEAVQASIQRAIETKSKWQSQIKYVMPHTGKMHTQVGFGDPAFLADGTIVFNSIILDITNQARNEVLLEQTNRAARIGSWEMDLVNAGEESMYWSPMIREILELNEDFKTTLSNAFNFYSKETRKEIKQAMEHLISDGTDFDLELPITTARGNKIWIRAIGSRELVNNKPIKIYGSFQDINEQKLAELDLKKSLKALADYKYSLDQSAIIAFTDAKGVIISANANFCEISGYSRVELEGSTHQLINSNYHPKEFFVDLWKTITSGKVWRGEIKNRAKNGTYYWVDTTIVPFLNEEKQPEQYLAIRFDITARKKAQENLTLTTERLQLATDSVKMGIWDWDVVNDKLTWDDKMYHLYGVKKENFSGAFSAWQKGLHPDDVDQATKDLNDALKGEREFHSVFRVIWPDQSVHYIEGNAIVTRDGKGNAVRVIGSNIDVTERINAQEDILRANERFEKVTEATNDAIWDWDIVNDTFYRSDAIERFFGKETKKAFTSKDLWKDNFHPEDKEKVKNSVEEAVTNPLIDKWQLDYRIIDETGETLYVIDQGVIIRDKKGKAKRMVGAMTDVTAQKKSERENKFKANLLKTVGEAAIASNLEGIITYWNQAAEKIYGWTAKEAIGKNLNVLTPSDVNEEQVEQILTALKSGQTWSGEFNVQRKDGTTFPARASNAPVYNEKNEVVGMIGISTDISNEVENENLLKQYTSKLERSNQQLRKIAWTQSHVVRAPLSRILGIINLVELQEGKVDNIETWLDQLKISTQEMDEIVKKIIKDANQLN